MTRATLASILGVVAAFLAASAFEEASMGRGVLAGALLAAAVGLGGALMQLWIARRAPKKLLAASAASFLAFLFAVLAGTLVLRYVPALSEATDYRGFLVSFGCVGFLLIVLSSLDVASVIKRGSNP